MLGNSQFSPGSLDAMRELRAKFIAPAAHCFVTHYGATLEQQFFNVAQAQLKPEIPVNGKTDHQRREAMAVIERFRLFHLPILRDRLGNVTKPGACCVGTTGQPLKKLGEAQTPAYRQAGRSGTVQPVSVNPHAVARTETAG